MSEFQIIYGILIIVQVILLYCLIKISSLQKDNKFLKKSCFLTATGLLILLQVLKDKKLLLKKN